MKKIDAAMVEESLKKIRADEKKWMKETMELLRGNLTDDERFAYEMELASVGFRIADDEREERQMIEAGHPPKDTEQRRKALEQRKLDKQWMEDTMKLLRGNLTDDERFAYEMELARVGFQIGADERDERRRQEDARRREEDAKKREEDEQERLEFEQKIPNAIRNVLKKDILSDEEIANVFSVSLEQIQEIKQQLKN